MSRKTRSPPAANPTDLNLIEDLFGCQIANAFFQSVKSAICNVLVDVNRIDHTAALGCDMFLSVKKICQLRLANIDRITNNRITDGVRKHAIESC